MRHILVVAVVLATELLSSAPAWCAPKAWTLTNTTALSVNRIGLIDTLDFKFTHPLFTGDGALWRDTFFAVRAGVALTPVYVRPRLIADIAPVSFLVLSAGYEPLFYFGNLGSLPTYPSSGADYPSPALQFAPKSPSGGVRAVVHQLVLAATLRAEIGPFQAMNRAQGMYFLLMRPANERAFYSVDDDILVARRAWVLRNETAVLYVTDFGLRAGLQHVLEAAQYPSDTFLPNESNHSATINSPTSRLGPLLAYRFETDASGSFKQPTLVLGANWWLRHRYRTGQAVNRALPYLFLAFSFSADL